MAINIEELIIQTHAKVSEIDAKLGADYRALYGNGKPGLIADVAELQKEMAVAKAKSSWFGSALAGWLSILAWLVTTAIALASLIKRG